MSENWNSKLKELIQSEVEFMNLEGDAQKQILANIHNQLNEGSKFIKFSKKNDGNNSGVSRDVGRCYSNGGRKNWMGQPFRPK